MSIFGENDSCCMFNFLQTHIFWNFDHISQTYNQINYRHIWFAEAIIILIMTTQVLFFNFLFLKKTRTLMPLSKFTLNFIKSFAVTQTRTYRFNHFEFLSYICTAGNIVILRSFYRYSKYWQSRSQSDCKYYDSYVLN